MLVVQFGDFGLIGLEMVRQHVVDVAEQRHFVLADDPQDKLYPLVVLLADIDRFADACGDGRLFQKQRAVIRLPAFRGCTRRTGRYGQCRASKPGRSG